MRKLLALAAPALLAAATAAIPAWGALGAQPQEWRVEWHEATEKRDVYAFGEQTQVTHTDASASVRFSHEEATIVPGNAVLISADLGRSTDRAGQEYVLAVLAPPGVKLAPAAPAMDTFANVGDDRDILTFDYVTAYSFARPALSPDGTMRLILPPRSGQEVKIRASQWWLAEFSRPGDQVFTITVQRGGQLVKRETITIPVAPGKGTWKAEWRFEPFGVSLGYPGAQGAQEAQEMLRLRVADAQVTLKPTGDLRLDPAGTFPLPLDGSPVWTRLSTNADMPTGRVEIAAVIKERDLRTLPGYEYGDFDWRNQNKRIYVFHPSVEFRGSVAPQIELTNFPGHTGPAPGPTPGGPGSGGFGRLWPFLPAAAGAPIVLGWALTRRTVDVWLEPVGGNRVAVRRGRRGLGRVQAVVKFVDAEGAVAMRELVLGRGETRQVEALAGWRVAELITPGRRNKGQPTRLEMEVDGDADA